MEKIGLVGPGKLGLCVALLLEEAGFEVTAVEKDSAYLEALRKKSFSSPEHGLNQRLSVSQIDFQADLKSLMNEQVRTILIYVPTPNSEHGYDHSILETVLNELLSFGQRSEPVNVMIGCTTLPGFLQDYSDQFASLNYKLVYSPSFIAQGSIIRNLQEPDILLFGSDHEESIETCRRIMQAVCKNKPSIHAMDLLSAEITKLATNCFLTAKIAFANAIGDLAIKTEADQAAILNAVGDDSRIGSSYLKYGFGFGGPCFPRDNRALGYFAHQNDMTLLISEATDKANQLHTYFQVQQYLLKHGPEETIHFDYVSYKPDSDILEESQQLKVALELVRLGRKVSVAGNSQVIDRLKCDYPDQFIYDRTNE